MSEEYSPSPWQAVMQQESWLIVDKNNKKIATIEKSVKSEEYAKIIAASPFMLEALQKMVALMADEDLPEIAASSCVVNIGLFNFLINVNIGCLVISDSLTVLSNSTPLALSHPTKMMNHIQPGLLAQDKKALYP